MNLYVLSNRGLQSSVSDDPAYELEDLLVETCDAHLLVPVMRESRQWVARSRRHTAVLLEKLIRRTTGLYQPLEISLPETTEPNVLLVIGISGAQLEPLSSIPDWRQRFDLVIGYVFDAWILEAYPNFTNQLDHLFVPLPEVIPTLQAHFGIPVSLLPFGVDALVHGSQGSDRPLDVISYGRIPFQFHQSFSKAFNQPGSAQCYYRSLPRRAEYAPTRDYYERDDRYDRQLLFHMLRRTKVALAFDTLYPGMRVFPYSFVTLRWFECGATGCAIAGIRPTTPIGNQLLNWQDAVIDLPDDPETSVQIVKDLLADSSRLEEIHRRNYRENLSRHDWRLRIQDLLTQLNLPLPTKLVYQLEQLKSLHLDCLDAQAHPPSIQSLG
jgi:hypothetical protein